MNYVLKKNRELEDKIDLLITNHYEKEKKLQEEIYKKHNVKRSLEHEIKRLRREINNLKKFSKFQKFDENCKFPKKDWNYSTKIS